MQGYDFHGLISFCDKVISFLLNKQIFFNFIHFKVLYSARRHGQYMPI